MGNLCSYHITQLLPYWITRRDHHIYTDKLKHNKTEHRNIQITKAPFDHAIPEQCPLHTDRPASRRTSAGCGRQVAVARCWTDGLRGTLSSDVGASHPGRGSGGGAAVTSPQSGNDPACRLAVPPPPHPPPASRAAPVNIVHRRPISSRGDVPVPPVHWPGSRCIGAVISNNGRKRTDTGAA